MEVAPHAALAQHIECFWSSRAESSPAEPTSASHRVLPDGAMDFIFQLAGSGQARVVGTMTRALVLPPAPGPDLVGVRFRPGGLAAFLPEHAATLTDRSEAVEEVAGVAAGAICDRLRVHEDVRARVSELERVLLVGLGAAVALDGHVVAGVRLIERTGGRVTSAELVQHLGIGERQLERRFLARVGVTPKFFARVVRFKAAQQLARSPRGQRAGWAGVASQAGYCDQAHLIRDFGALAGLSPGAWLKSVSSKSEMSNLAAPPRARLRA